MQEVVTHYLNMLKKQLLLSAVALARGYGDRKKRKRYRSRGSQWEVCGCRPHERTNIILLSPNGEGRSWMPEGSHVQKWRQGPTGMAGMCWVKQWAVSSEDFQPSAHPLSRCPQALGKEFSLLLEPTIFQIKLSIPQGELKGSSLINGWVSELCLLPDSAGGDRSLQTSWVSTFNAYLLL